MSFAVQNIRLHEFCWDLNPRSSISILVEVSIMNDQWALKISKEAKMSKYSKMHCT